MRFGLFILLVFSLTFFGCGGDSENASGFDLPLDVSGSASGVGPEEAGFEPVPLTKQASELRRLRDEHEKLIKSIPVVRGPTPTLTVVERKVVADVKIVAHPDGIPVRPSVDENWFNPNLGLTFYRSSGGDWTARRVRETHTHRNLFFYDGYPDSVLNFADKGIYPELAREMVFEATRALPILGDPTPAMVDIFTKQLGWELGDSSRPVVNLWSTFVVSTEGEHHVYSIGGVMLMGVGSVGEGEDRLEYVTPGRWLGPVIVERLG